MAEIGFIGAGNMAGAIINGILTQGIYPAGQVGVYDIAEEKTKPLADAGVEVFDSVEKLTEQSGIIVLAVKPQVFPQVMPLVKPAMTAEKVLVSIAAGIGGKYLQDSVGFPCKVILVMPNTPILLGKGATAMSRVAPAEPADFEKVRRIFAAAGVVEEVRPEQMNAVTAVHSTTPAITYLYAKLVVELAEKAGIDREAAGRLFSQMLVGSAAMMTETGKAYQELIDMVCSPGGATLAGLAALEENGFPHAMAEAFAASVRRAEELSL